LHRAPGGLHLFHDNIGIACRGDIRRRRDGGAQLAEANFARINTRETRLSVGAVHVRTSNFA